MFFFKSYLVDFLLEQLYRRNMRGIVRFFYSNNLSVSSKTF